MSKYKYMKLKGEEKFAESFGRALRIIDSGLKIGADNLEMILSDNDVRVLGDMTGILNIAEMDYKQGRTNKYKSLIQTLADYEKGKKGELRYIYEQSKNIKKEERGKYKGRSFVMTYEDKKASLLNSLEAYGVDAYHV